jgi:hypothetical protein
LGILVVVEPVRGEFLSRLKVLEQLSQERTAPTATGTRPKTFAQLPGSLGTFHTQEVDYFAFADVKTQTELVIQFHEQDCLRFTADSQSQGNPAGIFEVIQVQFFADHMLISLSTADRHGRNPVSDCPVRIHSTIGDGADRFTSHSANGCFRDLNAWFVAGQQKRLVIQLAGQFDASASTGHILDVSRRASEGLFNFSDDSLAEIGIVTPRFGLDQHTIGDDVGRVSPANDTYVAGTRGPSFAYQPVPAILMHVRDGQGSDRDRTDAAFRCAAGMAGPAVDRDLHAVATGGADRQLLRRPAVPIERQLGLSQEALLDEPRSVEPDLFLDKPAKRQRWVWEVSLQDFPCRRQDGRHTSTVVGPQTGLRIA